jgi:adenine-specific DNA-methyltransferase
MPTTEKLRNKLMAKLTELFQLDQPDLDFGFYRIMQAKAQQVKSFIDKDLLKIIEDAFGQVDESKKTELATAVEKAIQTAKDFGVPNPEETEPVKKAKAALNTLKDGATAESDVYDHLYRFFERYYDDGDFISRRYYARENAGKAAPFAIPYNGEEVKLHWANADQYYIKTTEYFSNYTFDITQAAEIRKMSDEEKVIQEIPDKALKIHFRIVDASEGEHGNVKAADDKKRFFVLHEENPIELEDSPDAELIVNFEYKSLPGGKNDVDAETEKNLKEKYGNSLNKGDMPNLYIADKVISLLESWTSSLSSEYAAHPMHSYSNLCGILAPTDKIPKRPLLAKYINQYTARNTYDYFIHKDLGNFLKRELDFYIKNEVMHLDDIENADAPAVENYLAKLKVIRKIATKLIEFLAQLEDFQKKLWLKKKFVTETNYCITLDRIPEHMYEEIAANNAQRKEWVKLFAIDEMKTDAGGLPGMGVPGYSIPLTTEFLKTNDKLVIDTAFFSEEFKAKLIESIENFDEECDGLLIHSENFQALNLLQERYREQVKCIYIDPPYNTNATPILYKNEYKSASWLSLLENRLSSARKIVLPNTGFSVFAIDDHELANLCKLLEQVFPASEVHKVIVNHYPGSGTGRSNVTRTHEYALFVTPRDADLLRGEAKESGWRERGFCRSGTGDNNYRTGRPNSFYAVLVDESKCEIVGFEPPPARNEENYPTNRTDKGFLRVYPLGADGSERCWTLSYESATDYWQRGLLFCSSNMIIKRRYHDEASRNLLPSVWVDKKYSAVSYGTNLLTSLFGNSGLFSYPKSLYTVETAIESGIFRDEGVQIMDYFAGSGTTGHAVINLNRKNGTTHKYTLVEMGDYFSEVTKPRIAKVVYSSDWKDGKPTSRDTGISHCFKYIRLESYEDTLNNLVFDETPVRDKAIESNPSFKEDYMLRYLLDVETRGSQSLLNIDAFSDSTAYTLKLKKPGSDEQVTKNIDLIETFNYLLGLRLENMAAPQTLTASFTRKPDPELPKDQHTKLVLDGKIQLTEDGKWWFRKLEGWVPADPMNPNNGQKERVLIVWRKLTGNLEEDNLMLNEWFEKYCISTRDFKYDIIYVNGSNNLPNLKKDGENWKVRLIEEEFMKRMWNTENA